MHPELLDNSTFLKYYRMWQENQTSVVFVPLAEFFTLYKMYDEAVSVCRTGLYYHPNMVSGRIAIGKAYIAKGDYAKAREHACHALHIMPDNMAAKKILEEVKNQIQSTTTKIETRNVEDYKTEQDKVVQKIVAKIASPKFSTVTIGKLYLKQGHYNKAKSVFKEILEKDPNNTEAQQELSKIEAQY
ncbi:tetratricopeptide repeat protein [bacterium]|nr:tetratricopeptide repeat protein [bacterium]